jgi:hypothetical protein
MLKEDFKDFNELYGEPPQTEIFTFKFNLLNAKICHPPGGWSV